MAAKQEAKKELHNELNKGNALYGDGRYEQALVSYNKCIELDPNYVNAYNNKGNALDDLKRSEDAIVCFNKCIELNPNCADAYNNKGLALYNLNRYEEAILSYNKYIELDPNCVDAYYNKGNALYNLNRYEDAILCFNKCIELNPNYVNGHYCKGLTLNNLNRNEEAIIWYNKCIELDRNHVSAYNNKGNALNNLNRHEEALISLNKCIELNPNDVNAYNNKGVALYGLNRYEEAILSYNKCIELDPNHVNAYNNKRIALKKLHGSEDAAILIVKYLFERQEKEVRVDVVDLERICFQNSMTFSLEGGQSEVAVSRGGLAEMRSLGERSRGLDEIGCLQIAMTKDRRVPDLLKKRILFGLLFVREGKRGLRVIKEDGLIVAPSFETQIPVSSLPRGAISFQIRVPKDTRKDPPDVSFLCQQKGECDIPIHQMIGFILEELKKLPPSETLMDDRFNFRLKSYSSIMNKLFYRGKELSDLLATTVSSVSELDVVKTALEERGGILLHEENRVNGNDCLVYRYVRILLVNVGSKEFPFPVYYEIVRKNFLTARVPHEQYELDRLEFSLNDGQMNILDSYGFTFETPR